MNSAQLYLPTLIPQWGIFAGVVLLTIGYVDKKVLWTQLGWLILTLTGVASLYFNLFGDFKAIVTGVQTDSDVTRLIATGWQTVAGGVLAAVSLLMFHFKSKRYNILAILTIIYFVLIFLMYLQLSDGSSIAGKTKPQTEQLKQ
jgi:hypothetical protein